jgi:hypothetical protein
MAERARCYHAAPGVNALLHPHDVYGEATFSGGLALLSVERQLLAAVLPPAVTLPPASASHHQCLVAFGEHANSTSFFGGLRLPWPVRFRELMVAVPDVRCTRVEGAHLFVQGMACDIWPAVWTGNVYFGFRKEHVTVQWNSDEFHVSPNGWRSCRASVRCTSGNDHDRVTARHDALQRIRAAVTMPVLGRRTEGTFVRSRFAWDFGSAAVDGASVTFEGGSMFPWLSGHTRDGSSVSIGLRVRGMGWRLSWPHVADGYRAAVASAAVRRAPSDRDHT